jgi:hypothetical protein
MARRYGRQCLLVEEAMNDPNVMTDQDRAADAMQSLVNLTAYRLQSRRTRAGAPADLPPQSVAARALRLLTPRRVVSLNVPRELTREHLTAHAARR